jgi:MAF protein
MFLLASNSPRRRQMLAWTGWSYDVQPVNVDESPRPNENPTDYVTRLARHKANAAAPIMGPWHFVLAADTIVVHNGYIFGKPIDTLDAAGMLRQLRGRVHQVYTAIAVLDRLDNELKMDMCITQVPMRNYSDEELDRYVASGDPMDKAGAYAIQNKDFHPVVNFRGCYASVAGLPLCHLIRTMQGFGVHSSQDIPKKCFKNLHYKCRVYPAVLRNEEAG